MSVAPDEGVFLDIEVMELVDGCIESSVPIYLMAQYAKCVEHDPLLSESYLKKLSKKMLDNWTPFKFVYVLIKQYFSLPTYFCIIFCKICQ